MREIKRQEEAELQKKREERNKIEATKLRKERRNALREAFALRKLTNNFMNNVVIPAQKTEYTPALTVYDIREYHPSRDNGVFVIGGFIGELLLVFTALYDYMLSNPANAEFKFSNDAIEKFLVDWMKEADFPEGTCVVKLKDELEFRVTDGNGVLDLNVTASQFANALKNPTTHQSFGLKFLLQHKKDVLLSDMAIEEIFTACAKVNLMEGKAEKPLPEEGADNYQHLLDAANAENEQIKSHNEALNKLKSKISLCVPRDTLARPDDAESWPYPEDPTDWKFWDEKCYCKVSNFKDPEGSIPQDESPSKLDKKSAGLKDAEKAKLAQAAEEVDPNAEPPFEIEKFSNKVIIIPAQSNAASVSAMVHHTDVSHFIRKAIIERAQKVWAKDLKELSVNQVLGHCMGKQKALEEKLEDYLSQLDWGRGQMHEDRNIKIIFNTFLQENDYRVDTEVLDTLLAKEEEASQAQA